MANSRIAGELIEFGLIEDFGDEADAGDGLEDVIVDGDDSGAFLAAVLEGMESQIAEARGFRVAVDSDHAALLAGLFVVVIGGEDVGDGVFDGGEKRGLAEMGEGEGMGFWV